MTHICASTHLWKSRQIASSSQEPLLAQQLYASRLGHMPAMQYRPPLAHPAYADYLLQVCMHTGQGVRYKIHRTPEGSAETQNNVRDSGQPPQAPVQVSKSGMLHAKPICTLTMLKWPAIDARRLAMRLNISLSCPLAWLTFLKTCRTSRLHMASLQKHERSHGKVPQKLAYR